jgi:hypothetical protein
MNWFPTWKPMFEEGHLHPHETGSARFSEGFHSFAASEGKKKKRSTKKKKKFTFQRWITRKK